MSNRLTRWANNLVLGEQRAISGYPDWATLAGGMRYPLTPQQTQGQKAELIAPTFASYVAQAYQSNGVVFACELARLMLFSEARFQWRRLSSGRPGELFSSRELGILERPWPGATTGDLLTRALQDADLGGNAFLVRGGTAAAPTIRRLRPDWVTIVAGSQQAPDAGLTAIDAEVVGYVYHPGGRGNGEPVTLLPEQVAHFAPIPDPALTFSGMSWITPVTREILGDSAANLHKLMFFEQGATPNAVVSLDASIAEKDYEKWVEAFKKGHVGTFNAYKTLYLGAGARFEVVGSDFKQMDFKLTQGAGETRIAAAAGVPPIIVGLSEGLAAATYSNYGQARRRFADGTMRPLWRNMAGSLERLIPAPPGAQLWYDDRDISFLQDDERDRAEIQGIDAGAIRTLTDAGFDPATAVDAIVAGDLSRLRHTNLYSVQLQPPGTGQAADGSKQAADLIAQVSAGLLTIDEARQALGRPPMSWSEELSKEESDMLISQVEAGLLTHDEARKLMKLGPAKWSDDLSADEITSLIAQVQAGLLTHEEARRLMKLGPATWSDDLSKEESDMLIAQVQAGLVTHDEARKLMKLPPMVWSADLSADEIASLTEQIKAGMLTENEARELLGRPPMVWPEDLNEKVEQAGNLIKAGFDPVDVMKHLGLPPMKHLGLPPVTVQKLVDAEPPEPQPVPDTAPVAPVPPPFGNGQEPA